MRSLLLGLLLGTLGPVLVDRLRYRLKSVLAEDQTGTGHSTEQPHPCEGAATDDLSQLTASELYRRAQAVDIAGRSGMSKAQLIAALRESTASSAEPD